MTPEEKRELFDRYVHRAISAEMTIIELQEFVAKQARDDGLWFEAQTAPEAYLQQELRRLHAEIERHNLT